MIIRCNTYKSRMILAYWKEIECDNTWEIFKSNVFVESDKIYLI